ncbi:MAG TPA: isocitrate dehydrogenase (NAD(+)) [Acidobacteriota bacterium]|jgi:isocitrate dehydrogenase (NAD+)
MPDYNVTLIPGDGIGPEIAEAVVSIFSAAKAPIRWDRQIVSSALASSTGRLISDEALASIRKNKLALKGPLSTPIGTGHVSLNLTLRKEFQLFANLRPCKSIPGLKTRYSDVDLIVVRENTEGEYSGLEHEVVPGVVESLKIITRSASTRIAEFAFSHAAAHKRRKVSAVHKANIMKKSDGLFLTCCREVGQRYPTLQYEEVIIDNCCLQLVHNPSRFDVIVLPNLYGDIVSDLCAGLVGGLGVTPSGNIGQDAAIFESVHGTAPDIAGQGKANPTALLLSGCMLLRHIGEIGLADRIEKACHSVIAAGEKVTRDLGGTASTTEFAQALIERL